MQWMRLVQNEDDSYQDDGYISQIFAQIQKNNYEQIYSILYYCINSRLIWNAFIEFICFGVVSNQYKKTPLHYACEKGHSDVAVKLIENKAAIDVVDWVGIE